MTDKKKLAEQVLENHKMLCDLVLLMNAYPPPNQRVVTDLLQQESTITEKTVLLATQLAKQVLEGGNGWHLSTTTPPNIGDKVIGYIPWMSEKMRFLYFDGQYFIDDEGMFFLAEKGGMTILWTLPPVAPSIQSGDLGVGGE